MDAGGKSTEVTRFVVKSGFIVSVSKCGVTRLLTGCGGLPGTA